MFPVREWKWKIEFTSSWHLSNCSGSIYFPWFLPVLSVFFLKTFFFLSFLNWLGCPSFLFKEEYPLLELFTFREGSRILNQHGFGPGKTDVSPFFFFFFLALKIFLNFKLKNYFYPTVNVVDQKPLKSWASLFRFPFWGRRRKHVLNHLSKHMVVQISVVSFTQA